MGWPVDEGSVATGLPLEGVRVLDCSRVLAGPFCAQVLGDLGADVIKLEQPVVGDPVRALGPPMLGDDATYYLATNRNRRSVLADLATADGRALLRELALSADVVVENFLPHQSAAFGIDELRAAAPQAVWVSVRPATSGGPLAHLPAFDLLAQARSGLMGVTGSAESGPMKTGAPIADVLAGLYAAVGALAGLYDRGRIGRGRHIEVPLLEAAMTALVNQAQGYLATGVAPQLLGNDHPSIAPYGPVDTADGPLLLAVGTERQFLALRRALGDPAELAEERFATNAGRVAARAALREAIERTTATRTRASLLVDLDAAGVPAAPINDVPAALAEEQVQSTGLLLEAEHATGPVRLLGAPYLIDGERLPLRRSPPALGADDAAVRAALRR